MMGGTGSRLKTQLIWLIDLESYLADETLFGKSLTLSLLQRHSRALSGHLIVVEMPCCGEKAEMAFKAESGAELQD